MMHGDRIRKCLVVGGTVAALAACAAPLASATPEQGGGDDEPSWSGDLDGDGAADRLTLRRGTDDVWSVRVDLASGASSSAPLSDDDRIPYAGLRVADVNSDGVDEVLAPTSVGANTLTLALLVHHDGALRDVDLADGSGLRIFEGGGATARNGYGCPADHDGRTLSVVAARLRDGSSTLFDGQVTTYAVAGDRATALHVEDVRGVPADDPALADDPESCAPAS